MIDIYNKEALKYTPVVIKMKVLPDETDVQGEVTLHWFHGRHKVVQHEECVFYADTMDDALLKIGALHKMNESRIVKFNIEYNA